MSDAVLFKLNIGVEASIVTVSSSVIGVYVPAAGVAFAVAVFVRSVPAFTSSCVTVYVAVKVWFWPGSRSTLAGEMADNVPEPE